MYLPEQPLWHVFHQLRHLRGEDLPQVNQVVLSVFHIEMRSTNAAKIVKRKTKLFISAEKHAFERPKNRENRC
jgi:hypothetical protein